MIDQMRGRVAFAAAATVGLGVLVASVLTWSPEPESGTLVAGGPGAEAPQAEPTAETTADAGTGVGEGGVAEQASPRPATPRQRVEDRRSYLLAVGDAFTTGSTLEGAPTWPTLLGRANAWEVRTIAADDAGYLVGGPDRFLARDGLTRLRRYPADLVVIAGGAADLAAGRAGLGDDLTRVVREVQATLPDSDVLLTSPFAPGRPGARTEQVADAARAVAAREGVGYLDVSRLFASRPELLRGGVPTAAGQRRIARAVERRLAARAWPRYDAWLDPAG